MKRHARTILIMLGLGILALVLASSYVLQSFSNSRKDPHGEHWFDQYRDAHRVDRFWAKAMMEEYKSTEELKAQDVRERRRGILYRKLMHGNPSIRSVAITFDDGPHPRYTPQLLAALRKYNVHATFFVVGKMAEQYPDLIKAEYAAGHEIGNHTYHHVNLTKIPDNEVAAEWMACNDVVNSIIGYRMRYCRPPGGDYDIQVMSAAMRVGLTTVFWTDNPGDYRNPGEVVLIERILRKIDNGSIILLHDGSQQTINVLPEILAYLTRRGFKFQTVDEMARTARVVR